MAAQPMALNRTKWPVSSLAAHSPRRLIDTDLICRLVAQLGREDFGETFGEACVRLSKADQITAFVVDGGSPRCLLAYRPRRGDLAMQLCRQYVAHFFERDTFLMAGLSSDSSYIARPVAISDIGDEAYRSRLFSEAGLASKFSVLQRHRGSLVYLNFYFRECPVGQLMDAFSVLNDHGELLVEAIGKHDALSGSSFHRQTGKRRVESLLRERFPRLSPREVQVCARIVTGHNAEAIALELELSGATVTTFRRRAYAKLGIASQSELFACCAGVMGD
jgi:DNA-binding CsgD family transcriptional regulator